MTQTVVTAGLFSHAAVLRPFSGFESKYQGLRVSENPIALPGSRDAQAGKTGYDPQLLAMLPVPMGARVKLWLPRLAPAVYSGTIPNYKYSIVWRVRSLADSVADPTDRLGAHFNRLLPGRAQIAGTPNTAGPRYVIPCATESIQTPVSPVVEPATVNVNSVQVQTATGRQWQAPIAENYPGGKLGFAGIHSQGFYPDGNGTAMPPPGASGGPGYFVYNTEAQGDEMGLLVTRDAYSSDNWDFTGAGLDRGLAAVLGTGNGQFPENPAIGVYVFTGSAA
jgi:hypothetical protein